MIKTIIVDDEPTAQEVLSELIAKYVKDKIEIVGICSTIDEAINILFKHNDIKLVFLDVQLGQGRTGFELFNYLNPKKQTVIFTTAFEKHAIQALKLNAIDYLLKPIHFPDLILAVNKAFETINSKVNSIYLETIYNELKNHNQDLKFNKLAILKGNEYSFIPFSQINYLEGDGNYTKIHTLDGTKYQTPRTLNSMPFRSDITKLTLQVGHFIFLFFKLHKIKLFSYVSNYQ